MNLLCKSKATLAALLGACAAFSLQAQTSTTTTTTATTTTSSDAVAPEENNPQLMAKFVVTGSNIQNAGEALSIPVAVLSPGDIQNSVLRRD